ncbi:Vegetative cell wall protein gp1 precursor (Hydroxyproline-rich glycoprotein 1) [Labilithrix luteola]|uniref:Vegetative cell wall protein gp1 (Hydroxyproline-rich glycoprotein 1) n=1 Tax=Labilithrix luteola TaxID=1391654 RepID=A0A0K1Q2J7_9BACT|nr:hypothetical protein [Labilithrix luteola]AKV00036.1 Vegetative cell wall protein gp1 precursor (Hydroxyproline-rich glycoprotein 1) [Labilithrix luteola]
MHLSSLIVQREIASIREVEEALARQVLYGGDLVTNLLEVAEVREAALMPVVAEVLGLPPAPTGELPKAAEEAQRLIAAEVAGGHNLAPLSVDRHGLVIAVAEPLSAEAEQELAFALALPITQRVAPLVRIRQALQRDYGIPLDRRFHRLLSRLLGEGGAVRHGSFAPPPLGPTPDVKLSPRPPSNVPAAPPSKISEPVRPASFADGGPKTLVREAEAPPARPLKRRRGPLTSEVAFAELDEAIERDTIFDLVFEFARQYFDYTVLFTVHGDIAEGRDAWGAGASRDRVARIGVPLDLPGILAMTREQKLPITKRPAPDGLDSVLMNDLARPGETECLVVPVIVRTRIVALVFGDGGADGVDPTSAIAIRKVVDKAASAFERVIVRRKLKGGAAQGGMSGRPAAISQAPPTDTTPSAAPPGKFPPKERPSVEELAAPVRELMNDPLLGQAISMEEAAARDAAARAVTVPPESPRVDLMLRGKTDNPPPPENILAVRRPSGRPIPREEPESHANMAAVKPPYQRTKTGSMQRQAAPPLEFAVGRPRVPSFGGDAFGVDGTEAALFAEIQGAPPTQVDPLVPPSPAPTAVIRADAVRPAPLDTASPSYGAVFDPDATPIAPPVVDPDQTPIAGSVLPLGEPPVSVPTDRTFPSWPLSRTLSSPSPDSRAPTPVPVTQPEPPAPAPVSAPATPPAPVEAAPAPAPSSRSVSDSGRAMPPSEQQISVAAHRPPSPRGALRALPSVIVDVASEYVAIVDRVLSENDDEAEAQLMRAGSHAIPAIMARFPGPLTVEPERLTEGSLPRVSECGPVLRLVASQRRTALPSILALVEDPDVEKRFWATYMLSELVYPDSIDPAIHRVFDEEARIRRVARVACKALAETLAGPVVERLEAAASHAGAPRSRRLLAIEALGETREVSAVTSLMPLLDDAQTEIAHEARKALVLITRQDFGDNGPKWEAWWEKNKDRERLEWLIDALMNDQALLRAAAGEELKTITKEYFGYYDDLPKRERERAQARYREWWNNVGRVRFSRGTRRG